MLFRKTLLKIHRLVPDAPDLQGVSSGNAVEKEMPRPANPISRQSRGLATGIEMIGSATRGDFGPLFAVVS